MNIRRKAIYSLGICGIMLGLAACEQDYTEVGNEMVDNDNFNTSLYDVTAIKATSKPIQKVQTNGLSAYNIGAYKDPIYGMTTSDIVAQLSLSATDPSFGEDPVVDSVVLTLPYYSKLTEQDAEGKNTYKLDSVYKYGNGQIRLSVYRTNYYLRSEDPDNDFEPQKYYSDQYGLFDTQKETDPLYENESYAPSALPVSVYEDNDDDDELDTLFQSPRLRAHLPVEYFQEAIIDQEGTSQLLSNANFQNYFRGIHIQSETLDANSGVSALLNMTAEEAGITIYYHTTDRPGGGAPTNANGDYLRTFRLNFSGNIVNLINTEGQHIPESNDDELYLKGGQGSMAVIDVFQDEEQLAYLREQNWLINEANLTFYVNENMVGEDSKMQPGRVFLYDMNNNRVLLDYNIDPTSNDSDPYSSRLIHLERLSKDENDNRRYKLRMTGYVNDILKKDSTNTKLGLVVSQNVNITTLSEAYLEGETEPVLVPSTSVLSQQGTVLYNEEAGEEAKKLKLNIYYTEAE